MLDKIYFTKKCEDLGVLPCIFNALGCITALNIDYVLMLVLKQ